MKHNFILNLWFVPWNPTYNFFLLFCVPTHNFNEAWRNKIRSRYKTFFDLKYGGINKSGRLIFFWFFFLFCCVLNKKPLFKQQILTCMYRYPSKIFKHSDKPEFSILPPRSGPPQGRPVVYVCNRAKKNKNNQTRKKNFALCCGLKG